jgi:peptidoglycan-associated lipoprotein
MKNLLAMFLIGGLLLAGCAKKTTVDEPVAEVAPTPAPVVAAPVEPVEPVQIAAPVKPEPKIEMAAQKILFDFDSYVLSSANKGALKGNALWLKAQPELRIIIEGHTDERGSSSYNLALGEKRAQAARDYLLSLGVAPERISIISYGKEKAATGADELTWALDRRAEFVLAN